MRIKVSMRREQILLAAVEIAKKPGGWGRLTRASIAAAADCSDGLVSRHFGDMCDVRKEVIRYAIYNQIVEILVQSLAAHDGYVVKQWLPKALKQKALQSLLG